ncbi:helix-hairpin-helix domain-containing protein [Nocardia sp. KC 131]|uniref:helix-hairpin-helix domain-containing protein n=1 Tax=Nocardia arseniciresistens TaxID=3392119 RepID=UPI00398F11AA
MSEKRARVKNSGRRGIVERSGNVHRAGGGDPFDDGEEAAGREWSASIGLREVGGRAESPESPPDSDPSGALRRSGEAGVEQLGRTGAADGGRWNDDRLPSNGVESGGFGGDRDLVVGVGEVRAPGWLDEVSGGSAWRDRLVPERFRGTRFDPGWRGAVTLTLVGLAAIAVATVVVLRERPVAQQVPPLPAVRTTVAAAGVRPSSATGVPSVAAAPGAMPGPPEGVATAELVVSVVGLVHNSGLLRIPSGSRVADAIAAAGGVRDGADLSGLNLAQRLQDGDQVLVGAPGPKPGPPQLGSTTVSAAGRAPGAAAPRSGSAPSPSVTARIDLNTAAELDLDALPGLGPVTARAIIAWRTKNGRFTDIEQLGEVEGIGPTRLARLRGLVKV